MNSRELFHATCAGIKCNRPPFWIMRQAGRYLPEYRNLKEKYSFLELVKNPELALEVALQPMRRFDFDCAILFSDILVVSEALGFPYHFKNEGGIILEKNISEQSDIQNLNPNLIHENLDYVKQNLKLLRRNLPQKAVIGFSATPFTLAAYMVEGSSSLDFPKFKEFIKSKNFYNLMEALTDTIIEYALMQIECGIDAFQFFDSHANLIPNDKYEDLSGQFLARILERIGGRARTIVYARGMSHRFLELAPLGADIYGLDSDARLSHIACSFRGHYSLQGNLDENLLSTASQEKIKSETIRILDDMAPIGRHIFNLGHGIKPDAKIENVEILCETIKNYKANE